MQQYGGGRMGGVALSAGGTVTQLFRNVPKGSVERLLLTVALSLKSSGSAFNAVVSTGASAAAEAIDDLDLLLNAIFSRFTIYWDKETMCGNLTPAQWRTMFGMFNIHDFGGSLVNGVSVPASTGAATAFTCIITIPVSLARYFLDGGIFAQGSAHISQGSIDYTAGSSLTPSVVLANGTAAVSAVSVSLTAETGAGTAGDVGCLWKVSRTANLPTIFPLPKTNGFRVFLGEGTPAATFAATDVSVGPWERIPPANYASKYKSERIPQGGFDVTARLTPYLYMDRDKRFLDFAALMDELTVDAATGASAQILYDVTGLPPSASAQRDVAQQIGAGGPVSQSYPSPASIPPGTPVPPELAAFLKVRIVPGRISDGGTGLIDKRTNPEDVASGAIQKQLVGQRVQQLGKLVKGDGI